MMTRVLSGVLAGGLLAATLPLAHADEWCGFLDKKGSRVRCGFSSLEECKQAVGDKKGAFCMPDPGFARNESAIRLAANHF
jgi:hypothetical protein